MRPASLIVVSLLAAVVGACDSVSPTAPAGSTLVISANPNRIASSGTSRITVIARKADGTPVNRGTLVFLTTNLGQLISSAATDDLGVVETDLVGNNAVGVATVRASVSGSIEASVDVQIGIFGGSITLQSTPSSIPETGGTLDLVALVRDDLGRPLAGAAVNFSTGVGVLDSGGGLVATDDSGTATDVLTVEMGELEVAPEETFEVMAETAGLDGQLVSDMTTISIQRLPRAFFDFSVNNSARRVVFQDQSLGRPTSWNWDFGDGASSQSPNPSHTYGADCVYPVTLTIRNSVGMDTASQEVTVGTGSLFPPLASFTFTTDDLLVDFVDTSDGQPATWDWDFGDGNESQSQDPSNLYGAPGTYSVSLRVTNCVGVDTASQEVTVETLSPPLASFTFTTVGLLVDFVDTSDGQPATWDWDFGDGNESESQNPSNLYGAPGTYSVSLRVTNSAGVDSVSLVVTVL